LLGFERRRLAGRTQTRRFAPQTVRPADRSNPALLDSLEGGRKAGDWSGFRTLVVDRIPNTKISDCTAYQFPSERASSAELPGQGACGV